MESKEHQLTAILFSDIVGYSAIMNRDEEEAWQTLQDARSIHLEALESYHGELLKELGDGFLACFSSVIDAVRCAKKLVEVCENMSFKLSIGIHLGDVIKRDGDVFGDGVNIAARLQQNAGENEVLISESVYLNIKNQGDLHTEFLGKLNLKNIKDPVPIYKLKDGKTHSRKGKRIKSTVIYSLAFLIVAVIAYALYSSNIGSNTIQKPTIAVLPFENLNGDSEQEYFSDGVSDEIRTKLGFIKGLIVRGRSSSIYFKGKSVPLKEIAEDLKVDFILEGSFRRFEDQVYFNLSLVDTDNDAVILPIQIQNRDLRDIYEVQADIAKMVADKLEASLLPEEIKRVEKIPTTNLEAYNYYLRARYMYLQDQSRENINRALDLLNRAIDLDENFTEAYAMKSNILMLISGWGYLRTDSIVMRAKPFAEKALELDPELSEAHYALGNIYSHLYDFTNALEQFEIARNLDPENDLIYFGIGVSLLAATEFNKALEPLRKAVKLNPYSPIGDAQIGMAYYNLGEYDSAIVHLERNIRQFPGPASDWAKWILGGVYQTKGNYPRSIEYYLDRTVNSRNVNFALGYAYAKSGQIDSAKKVLSYLINKSNNGYVPPSEIALIYAGLGVEDSAYYWMEKAHLEKDWFIVRVIPLYDSLLNLSPYKDWYGLSGLGGEIEQL